MIVKCNAKINISLKIVGKREDGYHLLDSVFLPINLYDTIKINKIKGDTTILINGKELICQNNICKKIALFMETKYQIKDRYSFNIIKRIPIGGGLGGGSSNACEIFKFYNNKYKLNISVEDAIQILKKYGADIPFFLINKPSRIQGIGEIIKPINVKNEFNVLLVNPNINISTQEIYKLYDSLNLKSSADIDNVIKCLENNCLDSLSRYLGNDLEYPAFIFSPKIKNLKNDLISFGLKNVLMTGSGSTLIAISNNKNELKNIYKKIDKNKYFCCLITTKY